MGGGNEVGKDGKSAYEIALDKGFEGSEEEWLNSLKGTDGINGICYGNYSGIDWNNTFIYETITEDTNYYYVNATAEVDGLVKFYAALQTASWANTMLFRCLINANDLYTSSLRQGANTFSCFVSKGENLQLQITKTNVTANSIQIKVYPYKKTNTYSTDETIVGTWIMGSLCIDCLLK